MSQNWHAHWLEESYYPKRLNNWQISKWYPNWPDRRYRTTKFIANDNGHIIDSTKKIAHSAWNHFKTTWDLPLKINKTTAQILSSTPEYKKKVWQQHLKNNREDCKNFEHSFIERRYILEEVESAKNILLGLKQKNKK